MMISDEFDQNTQWPYYLFLCRKQERLSAATWSPTRCVHSQAIACLPARPPDLLSAVACHKLLKNTVIKCATLFQVVQDGNGGGIRLCEIIPLSVVHHHLHWRHGSSKGVRDSSRRIEDSRQVLPGGWETVPRYRGPGFYPEQLSQSAIFPAKKFTSGGSASHVGK